MKEDFFQAISISVLLYDRITWILIKRLEKELDDMYTKMLRIALNLSRKKQPHGQISLTSQVIREKIFWRGKIDFIIVVLAWTPKYGQAGIGHLFRISGENKIYGTFMEGLRSDVLLWTEKYGGPFESYI